MPEARGALGRGRELGALSAFLDDVPSGPSGLLIEGEAGIGKTTVWTAGVAGAVARSYLVLSSRPTQSEAKLSFAVLGDLLDGVLERALPELRAPQQNALLVALLLRDPAGSPLEDRAVCAALLGLIRCLTAQSPPRRLPDETAGSAVSAACPEAIGPNDRWSHSPPTAGQRG